MKTEPVGYSITIGENLPNHSVSLQGKAKFVRITATSPVSVPTFRTRQEAFRVCAAVLKAVQDFGLPDEEDEPLMFTEYLDEVMPEWAEQIGDE